MEWLIVALTRKYNQNIRVGGGIAYTNVCAHLITRLAFIYLKINITRYNSIWIRAGFDGGF